MTMAARERIAAAVPRETLDRLDTLVARVVDENQRQNLVADATLDTLWSRHVEDSLQLLDLAPSTADRWLDIGSGAGFPGLVVACVLPARTVLLLEPRAKRAAFLEDAAAACGLPCVEVVPRKVEMVQAAAVDVITARAVAPLPRLLGMALHLSTAGTTWILPKGRSAERELAETRKDWQGRFEILPSATDGASGIVRAHGVARKAKR